MEMQCAFLEWSENTQNYPTILHLIIYMYFCIIYNYLYNLLFDLYENEVNGQ